MKILITGSSGFIGKKIIDFLKSDNLIQIIRTTRNQKEVKEDVIFYDIYNIDFNTNLFDYFNSPDVILHCAWDNVKDVSHKNHLYNQVLFHIKLLDNLIKNGIKKAVILGTCFEYGKINGEVSESLTVNPITNYAIAKNLLRIHVESLKEEYNFILQWIRVFYAYDKTGQTGNNIVHHLKESLDSKNNVFNMTDGKKELDFIEINDLCFAIKKIVLQNKINGIINCCSGKPQSISSLVDKCLNDWNKSISLNKGYYSHREFEPDYFYGSTIKLKKILK
ncbi:NAD(P)-dependent oxidoreductase [Flavobacteriaceae bacterium]|nr:NAD(P)-dependent oxidoreductase [Flavobacteriaceae bacterium]